MKALILLMATLLAIVGCGEPNLGDYLGEPTPGDRPVVFAPGKVSTSLRQRDTAISPDGALFFYTVWGEGRGTLVFLERRDAGWSDPDVAPFSGIHSDIEPFFHPAGGRLYFASKRPLPGESESGDWNIWSVERRDDSWAEPLPLDGVNQDGDEYYPAVTIDGAVYFTAQRDGSLGGEDIFVATPIDGGYAPARNLGPAVNSEGPDFNAFVSGDGTLLLFSSLREGDEGGGDLYVSFGGADGSWAPALPLGPAVNSSALDYCPFLTPDRRFLFFTSNRAPERPALRRSFDELIRDLNGPENGQGSLYWVDAGVLEELSGAGLDED